MGSRSQGRLAISDRDLQELERRLKANPDDSDLALRYDRALLRAGRDAEVHRRYEARFACELGWSELREDARSDWVRTCQRCGEDVTLVRDRAALERTVADGQRVAGTRELLQEVARAVVSTIHDDGPAAPRPACFAVAGELPEEGARGCSCLSSWADVEQAETRLHQRQQQRLDREDFAEWSVWALNNPDEYEQLVQDEMGKGT